MNVVVYLQHHVQKEPQIAVTAVGLSVLDSQSRAALQAKATDLEYDSEFRYELQPSDVLNIN